MTAWRRLLRGTFLVASAAACAPGTIESETRPDAAADVPRALDAAADAPRGDVTAPPRDVPIATDLVAPRDVPDVIPPRDAPPAPDVVTDPGTDDAEIVEAVFPSALGCTARATATVRVRNRGTSTWTTAAGYALGAVDDADPLHRADTRVRFPTGESVPPGAERVFTFPLQSPGTSGTYVTDWRMVHDGVRWFGDATSQTVGVDCATTSPGDFRLSDVNIMSSPDVRGFPVTSRITELGFRPGTFHVDHSRRGTWPPVVIAPDGTTQEATVWVFFRIGGTWYGTGGERLRPNQTDKALDNPSALGPDWLYDRNRWGVMTNYVPSPGELVGFMVVAGSTRSDDQTPVRERTGVVLIRFPEDGVASSFPPFAWEE